jgi:phosphopantetheinyl transferase
MNEIELPGSWRHRAIVVRDVEIADDWFTAEELAEANTFRLPKRREEWLHARMAAKQLAVERGLATTPSGARVTRAHFSLSHSHPYAAASLGGGIDVQVVREISESAAHLFLTDDEIAAMQQLDIPHRMLHFWCAKEAAWKAEGGAIATLKRVPLKLVGVQSSALSFERVETIALDDAIIALTS